MGATRRVTRRPLLFEGQELAIDLSTATSLRAVVLGFAGPTLFLMLRSPADGLFRRAAELREPGMVLVDTHKGLKALRGRAGGPCHDDEVLFTVTDAFRLGQQRFYGRATVALPCTLRPDGRAAIATTTRDLSCGGVAVETHGDDLPAGTRVEVELTLTGAPEPLTVVGVLLRDEAEHRAVRFTGGAPGARLAIMREVVGALRRQVGDGSVDRPITPAG